MKGWTNFHTDHNYFQSDQALFLFIYFLASLAIKMIHVIFSQYLNDILKDSQNFGRFFILRLRAVKQVFNESQRRFRIASTYM